MDFLSRDDFKALMQRRQGWCLSLYMPAHRIVPEAVQDPIRFKNLLRQAGERLQARGLRAAEAEQMLRSAEKLLDDKRFWQHQSDGLVTFMASDLLRSYRLPLPFEELVVVNDRFYLKPLLPLLSGDDRFYVLALSQKEVRLLKCTRYLVSEVELQGVPQGIAEALPYEDVEKKGHHYPGSQGRPAGGVSPLAGHGVGIEDATHEPQDPILRYFQQVDAGLRTFLRNEHAPLMLATVDYLLPIYRQANTYPHLMNERVSGNPEGRRPDELHAQAWKLIEPYFRRAQEEAFSQYHRLAGTGRTSTEIRDILPAAAHGRVACLCVAVGLQQWGTYAADTGAIEMHSEAQPGDEDLLDLAAMLTVSNSGTVYAVEPARVPGGAPLAAIYRY